MMGEEENRQAGGRGVRQHKGGGKAPEQGGLLFGGVLMLWRGHLKEGRVAVCQRSCWRENWIRKEQRGEQEMVGLFKEEMGKKRF